MADQESVEGCLRAAGLNPTSTEIGPNQVRIEVDGVDAVINIWHSTGTCQVQGRDADVLTGVLGDLVGRGRKGRRAARPVAQGPQTTAAAPQGAKKVFVVYGHDTAALAELEAMLHRWGLQPLILDRLPNRGQTIIEKLEYYQQGVEWAVVLLTPDDLGHPALKPTEAQPRARQNVVLEMGMLLGKLGRERVVMLYKKSEPAIEPPSDVNGYLYVPYTTSVTEAAPEIIREMATADFYHVPAEKI